MLACGALTLALLIGPNTRPITVPSLFLRTADITMGIIRYEAGASADTTNEQIDSMIETSGEAVFVLSYSEAGSLSNAMFERTISKYEASQLYGGTALACTQILCGDGAEQDEVCRARGISEFPRTEVWRYGKLVDTVGVFDLEATLVKLGVRCADNSAWKNAAKGSNVGWAPPSATAVDDIDFTGGGGQGGRPIDMGRRVDRGTTQNYFPFGETDKPGDDIGDSKKKKK